MYLLIVAALWFHMGSDPQDLLYIFAPLIKFDISCLLLSTRCKCETWLFSLSVTQGDEKSVNHSNTSNLIFSLLPVSIPLFFDDTGFTSSLSGERAETINRLLISQWTEDNRPVVW